jgi:glycosyltransferase involved in cell wall biosynthesis
MAAEPPTVGPRRVTLVADELLGYHRTGGLGTATTFLAVALARLGHHVEVLYLGDPPTAAVPDEWSHLYEGAGVKIRLLPRSGEVIEPSYFRQMHDAELALLEDPPDVVVTQDLAAPMYTALRMRSLGLAFERTAFVVYCHGTRQWITDVARKARVLPGALAIGLLERASIELADAVVSPSAYLLDWMRDEGWRLPERSLVIPYLTRSAATGETPTQARCFASRVETIAFFGRLEERKGLRPFLAGLNEVEPKLLGGVSLEFLGRATPAWPPERVASLLSPDATRALRRVSFETALDQPEALARLSRPGTLAVMPSLADNSPNAVYECLERSIPFLASAAGGTGELIAEEDRARVTFDPTPEGVAGAISRALAADGALRPVRPAFDPLSSLERWADAIGVGPSAPEARNTVEPAIVSRAEAPTTDADWVVLLEPDDAPAPELVDNLTRAQAASGADVVTCGIALEGGVQRFFIGEPAGLGVLANHYGTTALIRRSLVPDVPTADWPMLARASLDGAQIVSIPRVLAERRRAPSDVEGEPGEALLVAREFERRLERSTRPLARLAAGLGASTEPPSRSRPGLVRKLLQRLRKR